MIWSKNEHIFFDSKINYNRYNNSEDNNGYYVSKMENFDNLKVVRMTGSGTYTHYVNFEIK